MVFENKFYSHSVRHKSIIPPICAGDSFGTGPRNRPSHKVLGVVPGVVLGVIFDAAARLPRIALEALPRVTPGMVSIVKLSVTGLNVNLEINLKHCNKMSIQKTRYQFLVLSELQLSSAVVAGLKRYS